MKILKFTAENFKRLRVVEIVPDSSLVRFTGRNGSGKSSNIDAVYWALAGASVHGSKPVREGEERAVIRLDMGEIVVTRRFTAAGGTSLTVEAPNGAQFKTPQRVVEQLFGNLSFDPLAFSRMAPKDQLEALRGMVDLELDVDALDAENKRDYDRRTEVGRDINRLEQRVVQLDGVINQAMTDITPIDTAALLERMASASDHNAEIHRQNDARSRLAGAIDAENEKASQMRQAAEEMVRRAAACEAAAVTLHRQLDAMPEVPDPINVSALTGEIEAAQRENAARATEARTRRERHDVANELQGAVGTRAALTQAMDERQALKASAIAAAKMPIDGLGFGDGEVLYRGIPFSQASSAEQLRVSVALAMASNPKLRVLLIKDGSLLDTQGLEVLRSMAEANDYQVWIETVDDNASVGFHMEDGAIVAVNGQAVEQPERSEAEATEPALAGAAD